MKSLHSVSVTLFVLLAVACSDERTTSGGGAGASSTAGSAGAGGTAGSSGNAGTSGASGTAGSAGTAGTAGTAGAAGTATAENCSTQIASLLTPIDQVSTGEVVTLSSAADVLEVFVDASAGGQSGASTNPRVYLSLATGERVNISDVTAPTSDAWDIALKRAVVFTNSGDAGPGQGGALFVAKEFAEVNNDDLAGVTLLSESFVDQDCTALTDGSGAVQTSFSDWYDYDPSTHMLAPKHGTYLVRAANGSRFKLSIDEFYGTPEGEVGTQGGKYILRIGAL